MSAEGIFANLKFCIPMGIIMFLSFCILRRKIPVFYHRNVLYKGRAILPVKVTELFGWISLVLKTKDEEILMFGGLDALVIINTFKLLLMIVSVMAIPCLFILVPYYYYNSDHSEEVTFMTFTISDMYTETFWPSLLVQLFITFSVLYILYCFYRNYARIRQLYLARPSAFTCLGTIIDATDAFGSLDPARNRFDCASKTVLLHPISDEFSTPDQVQEALEKAGIQGITAVQFIGDFRTYKKTIEERNASLVNLEKALRDLNEKLAKAHETETLQEEESDGELSIQEKSKLLKDLIRDKSIHKEFRSQHKIMKKDTDTVGEETEVSVDSIEYYYFELVNLESKLHDSIKAFNTPPQTTPNQTKSESGTVDENLNFDDRFLQETAFINWNNISEGIRGKGGLALKDGISKNQVVLISFSTFSQANRAQQLLLTSRPHAMTSTLADDPSNINWSAIKWTPHERWIGVIKSNFFYWLFIALFAPIVGSVVAFINLKSAIKWFPGLEDFQKAHPSLRPILQGILAPLITTRIMKTTGKIVTKIMALRGPMSKSQLATHVQGGHLFFLFFQVIIIGAMFSSTYELAASILASQQQSIGILDHLRTNLPKKAHFFFNFLIQDIFNELALELLNPKTLLRSLGFIFESNRRDKSTRSLRANDTTPPKLSVATTMSRFILFPFLIVMTYAVVSPLIIIPAIAYYSVAFFVFKYRYVHFGRNLVESGGLFWSHTTRHITYALILGQISLLIQYGQFRSGYGPVGILILSIILTWASIPFFEKNFKRVCENVSCLENEIKITEKVSDKLLNAQNQVLPEAIKSADTYPIIQSRLGRNSEVESEADINEKIIFKPYWSLIPVSFSELEESASEPTFDPYHVDNLVDLTYVNRPYEHPLILRHSQVIIVPKNLPNLLNKTGAK